jgi:hypothetical protein
VSGEWLVSWWIERPPLPNLRITTTSGSIYELDTVARTWRRTPSLGSGTLRSEGGPLIALHIAGVGSPAIIWGPPMTDDSEVRLITTSAVVAIEPFPGNAEPMTDGQD